MAELAEAKETDAERELEGAGHKSAESTGQYHQRRTHRRCGKIKRKEEGGVGV